MTAGAPRENGSDQRLSRLSNRHRFLRHFVLGHLNTKLVAVSRNLVGLVGIDGDLAASATCLANPYA